MSFFPPQKLIQEIPSVYETLHNLGATLWIPPSHANGVNQFVYPYGDPTPPLAGTVSGVTFDQSGGIPEILDGAPLADFPGTLPTYYIDFGVIPVDDPLQMNSAITIVWLGTPNLTSATYELLVSKSVANAGIGGYSLLLLGSDGLGISTNGSITAVPIITRGVRSLCAASIPAGGGTAQYYCNGITASGSSEPQPSNTAARLKIGQYGHADTVDRQARSKMELVALIPRGLTTTQLDNIAAMCGNLG